MQAIVESLGSDLWCHSPRTQPPEIRLDGEAARAALEDWANRYGSAVSANDAAALLAIGREIFDWLDTGGWATAWARATGTRALEIRIDDPHAPLGRALLDAPWELLAGKDGHLADDAVQLFEAVRRIGARGESIPALHADLQLMFMAAEPAGQSVLDYEAEEAAILQATEHLPLHLVVEESGAARYLGERLDLDGSFEALHLSCHGTIDAEPVLLIVDDLEKILETPAPSQTGTRPVQAPYRAALAAILSAFGRARTDSRLLLTSRYRFTLPDGSERDLAETSPASRCGRWPASSAASSCGRPHAPRKARH